LLQTSTLNLFVEDSKFISNKSNTTKENSSIIESNNNTIVEKFFNDNTKNKAIAKKSNSKITSSSCFIYNAIYSLLFCSNRIYLV